LIHRGANLATMIQDMAPVLRSEKRLISRYAVDLYTCEQAFNSVLADKPGARH
jgi:hypothetical protein